MNRSIAIVGASGDRRKYGNKAVRAFRDGGWTVYPVNPNEAEVEGLKAYATLRDVPEPLDRISMYVPPAVGIKLLDDIAARQPVEVFFNPGSDSPELLQHAREKGLQPIQACSIVNIGLRPEMYPDE
ncbi:MAG: CoA-binding protein [FCB group bacterium]|nr:CoA-binding protein [FCB group bacterium]